MISAEVNGSRYDWFEDYEVNRSVEELTGTFSLTMSSEGSIAPEIIVGNGIRVFVDNTPILTGFVERLDVSYSADSHVITIAGRDKTCDLVDSTIGHKIELKAPVTLDQIVQKVMKEIQMTGVPIHVNVDRSELRAFTSGELVSGQIDEKIFSFLEKYTRKRQVLMTTDGRGGFVLTRAGQEEADSPLFHRVESDGRERNNILSANISFDFSERYHLYRISSQGNPSASNDLGTTNNSELVNRMGSARDPVMRATRILDLTAESSTDNATLTQRAKWEANVRAARSITYNCVVQGHTMTPGGRPWAPNLLVRVIDEYAEMDAKLLIKTVRYTLALNGGSVTEMELVHPDSFLPEPIDPDKKSQKVGRSKKKRRRRKSLGSKAQNFYDMVEGD